VRLIGILLSPFVRRVAVSSRILDEIDRMVSPERRLIPSDRALRRGVVLPASSRLMSVLSKPFVN
jgi:hypothetical protein